MICQNCAPRVLSTSCRTRAATGSSPIFLKLFERIYAPLTAALLSPVPADGKLQSQSRSQLDRLYQRVVDDLNTLIQFVGLKAA